MKKPGLLDRLLRAVGLSRTPQKRGGFQGAVFNRLTSDWIKASLRSANMDLRGDLRTLRARSRDSVRNTSLGVRFHQLVRENVVGPHGIRLQAKNAFQNGKPYETANTEIEGGWERWSRLGVCDASGKHSLKEFLALAAANRAIDGEILIRKIRGKQRNGWGFSVLLMDPDLLDDNLHREPVDGLNAIRQGVEIDEMHRPVGYWCFTRHPSEALASSERIRYPAEDIIHVFRSMRPGQSRGYPDLAPAILSMKMLDGYIEAELVAARTASATMGAIETSIDAADSVSIETGAGEVPLEAEPGALLQLLAGQKLSLWDPQHPTSAFDPFVKAIKLDVATALGVSYSALTGDLSGANFSSMRAGMLPERDHWRSEQQFLIEQVLEPIFAEWLPAAALSRQLELPSFDLAKWSTIKWQPRGFDWVDPMKDTQSGLMEVGAGISTLTQLAAEQGRDLEDVLRERKAELELADALGVPLTLDANPKTTIADAADAGDAATSPARALRVVGGRDRDAG